MEEKQIQIRPLSFNDDLQRVAELIYKTDIYISILVRNFR